MTDGPDIAMRLCPLKFFLSHPGSPSFNTRNKLGSEVLLTLRA